MAHSRPKPEDLQIITSEWQESKLLLGPESLGDWRDLRGRSTTRRCSLDKSGPIPKSELSKLQVETGIAGPSREEGNMPSPERRRRMNAMVENLRLREHVEVPKPRVFPAEDPEILDSRPSSPTASRLILRPGRQRWEQKRFSTTHSRLRSPLATCPRLRRLIRVRPVSLGLFLPIDPVPVPAHINTPGPLARTPTLAPTSPPAFSAREPASVPAPVAPVVPDNNPIDLLVFMAMLMSVSTTQAQAQNRPTLPSPPSTTTRA
ncbi:uncharacterized protein B0T23DRAFT_399249 [Neurospora hispaniola]|uniref:Uncharacterized protein n=1 Tax=Neurospora hispaniola TaxID=588809 RepID=A0AAJ0I0Y1_9PEZI|nr:hypothetical protein B0T23DRAFT_399249 [Neurospora hispaniola]